MSAPCTCSHTYEQHEQLFHVDESGACSPHGHRCHGFREGGSFRTPCDCTSYWTGPAAPAPEAPPPAEPAGPYRTPAPPPAPASWGQKIWCVCKHVAGDHLNDELAVGGRSCQAEGCTCDCFSTKRDCPTCSCTHPMSDHPTATSCCRFGCTCGRYEDEDDYAASLQQLARELVDSLPKCGCGGLATVELLVPFEYTYTACLHCAGRRLMHGMERAKPLPHAAQAALLLQLLPGGAAVWAELTRPRTDEEQRAAHDRRFPPEET